MDMQLKQKDHSVQADRLTLTSKVADTVEDMNKKLLTKEMKLREEMQERYLQLERVLLIKPIDLTILKDVGSTCFRIWPHIWNSSGF